MKIFSKFKQLKREFKIVIITVLLVSCVGVYATGECIISATADDVTYKNTTVQAAIDELFAMSENYCPPGYECIKPAIIKATSSEDTTAFRSDTYRAKIKTITLDDQINPPSNVIESWDIGEHQNGDVMAYITQNNDDNTMYNLYIQGDGSLYANPNSSYLFNRLYSVDSINGISKLNTTKVTNMNYMFSNTGSLSDRLTLDLGNNFDTSKVTDMNYMFFGTGYSSTEFKLDLGDKFDTSNVEYMLNMFADVGAKSTKLTLDLGNKFDTKNVKSMYGMFSRLGCPVRQPDYMTEGNGYYFPSSSIKKDYTLLINLGNKFDTRNVTDMNDMFDSIGCSSSNFTLDLGDKFDTSKVTDMSRMFESAGYNSENFTLDLGDNFDTSNVTDMSSMFEEVGYKSTLFTLNLGEKFNTSNVTRMYRMFESTGYNNQNFTLDLGNNFNTSNVTDMAYMFSYTGYSNSNLVLDLSLFDFGNVTNYTNIFTGMRSTGKIYVGNSTARNWIINNSGNSSLTTSNVLIKS